MLVLKDEATGIIYPADRCSWIQSDAASGYGYTIGTAKFYDGVNAGAALTTPVLGHIGKSGRFVEMTAN